MTSAHERARIDVFTGGDLHASSGLTMPWEVPPGTVVIEYFDGRWRVVPHRGLSRSFATRAEAWAWARQVAACYLPSWTIVEKDPASAVHEARRVS
jgi:hypothetical protein